LTRSTADLRKAINPIMEAVDRRRARKARPLSRWLKIGAAHHDLGANHFDRCFAKQRVAGQGMPKRC
jgi:hypothetical protein